MRMRSVLVCLPHEQEERNNSELWTILFFNALIEELRVVKRLSLDSFCCLEIDSICGCFRPSSFGFRIS